MEKFAFFKFIIPSQIIEFSVSSKAGPDIIKLFFILN